MLSDTCVPPACARVSGAVRVMPVPETCASASCAYVSGVATAIAGAGNLLMVATAAVSEFAPLSIVMVSPLLKPIRLATGMMVAPAAVAVRNVVAPAVPTVAMTAFS